MAQTFTFNEAQQLLNEHGFNVAKSVQNDNFVISHNGVTLTTTDAPDGIAFALKTALTLLCEKIPGDFDYFVSVNYRYQYILIVRESVEVYNMATELNKVK